MNQVIVSMGIGGIYPSLLRRLEDTCHQFGVNCRMYRDYPPGARPHGESPYGFKLYAIQDAVRQGFTTVVWADSACFIVKDPSRFFDLVRRYGVLFLGHGDRLGMYVNDRSLEVFGYHRDDIKDNWMISGSLFGFDFTNPLAVGFFEDLVQYEKGGWFCEDGQQSYPGFQSHRHDEAIISLLLIQYGIDTPNAYDYFQGQGNGVMFRAMRGI